MRRPLTCFLVPVLALCGVVARTAQAQISPGALSRAHSSLEGATNCTVCHDIGKISAGLKCLDCHKDIRSRLDAKKGLHPSLMAGERSGRACAACHLEHNGRDFALIRWDAPMKDFDHNRAAYTLEGRHARLACRECHKADRIPPGERSTISVKDLNRTFLGLPRDCLGCHSDEHRGQLPSNCASCHTFSNWKTGVVFDHRRAKFTLEGAHEKVACAKCHTRTAEGPGSFVRYSGLSFEDCSPCHADPHQRSFSAPCSSCHNASSWKPVAISSGFNHSETGYPLLGKHESVACRDCHRSSNFHLPLAHAQCMDCHVKDPHRGQFTEREGPGDCSACHNVRGFVPTTFTAVMHDQTSYPLEGRHSPVPCVECHAPRGPDTVYRLGNVQCSSCHSDVHAGQFSREGGGARCEGCHGVKGFRPSSFTLERHMKTRFPLTGLHAAVTCGDCHQGKGGNSGVALAKYRFPDRSCAACHTDPHRGQFAGRTASASEERGASGCANCHTVDGWSSLVGFDHSTTPFGLDGAHRSAPCDSCHRTSDGLSGITGVVFKAAPRRCAACHEDPHQGQFRAVAGSDDCQRCHGFMRWKPADFDHDTKSAFKLAGAHQSLRCELCHPAEVGDAGKLVFKYRGTPRECAGCHRPTAARE